MTSVSSLAEPALKTRDAAERLAQARAQATGCERTLRLALADLMRRDTARRVAGKLGVSVGYANNVKHAKRHISDQFLAKVLETYGGL